MIEQRKKTIQVHATNVTGLGAEQVLFSLVNAKLLSANGGVNLLVAHNSEFVAMRRTNLRVKVFKRLLPKSLSRLLECIFSWIYFANLPTLVLGDIPLKGLDNQVVLVHQPNLIRPRVNPHSGRSFAWKVQRLLFSFNQKSAKFIVVQSDAMYNDLLMSYPSLSNRIVCIPQPAPTWLKRLENVSYKGEKYVFFYPSAGYPHKKHEFFIQVHKYILSNQIKQNDFEVWVTLPEARFEKFRHVPWLKNLGLLGRDEMNMVYSQTNSLLFISSLESFGLPLVEALSLNMPIYAVDLPYVRSLCENKINYFDAYVPGDFVRGLRNIVDLNFFVCEGHYESLLHKLPSDWLEVYTKFEELLLME